MDHGEDVQLVLMQALYSEIQRGIVPGAKAEACYSTVSSILRDPRLRRLPAPPSLPPILPPPSLSLAMLWPWCGQGSGTPVASGQRLGCAPKERSRLTPCACILNTRTPGCIPALGA